MRRHGCYRRVQHVHGVSKVTVHHASHACMYDMQGQMLHKPAARFSHVTFSYALGCKAGSNGPCISFNSWGQAPTHLYCGW
jgi:hypothetical protein